MARPITLKRAQARAIKLAARIETLRREAAKLRRDAGAGMRDEARRSDDGATHSPRWVTFQFESPEAGLANAAHLIRCMGEA